MGGSGLVAIALLVLAYAAVSRRLVGIGDHRRRSCSSPAASWRARMSWAGSTRRSESESVRWVAEATLTVVLFSDASRIDLRALRREYVVPLRLLGDRAAADDRRRRLAGVAAVRPARADRGRAARDRARADRRRARAGGRYRPADPVAHPPGPERRERAQRRHLRAAAPDRDRDRRGARRARSDTARRCIWCSRRSATGSSEACLRALAAAVVIRLGVRAPPGRSDLAAGRSRSPAPRWRTDWPCGWAAAASSPPSSAAPCSAACAARSEAT